MKALVMGGTGLAGKWLVAALAKGGHDTSLLVHRLAGRAASPA